MSIYDTDVFKAYLAAATEKHIFVERFAERYKRQPGTHLLDLGCHNGELTLQVLEACPGITQVTAVDPSASAILEFAARKRPAHVGFHFIQSTAEEFLDLDRGSYDWAIASHSLYWSSDLVKVLIGLQCITSKIALVMRGSRGIYQVQEQFKEWIGNPNEELYFAYALESIILHCCLNYVRENIVSEITLPATFEERSVLLKFFLQNENLTAQQLQTVDKYVLGLGNPMLHDVSFFWLD